MRESMIKSIIRLLLEVKFKYLWTSNGRWNIIRDIGARTQMRYHWKPPVCYGSNRNFGQRFLQESYTQKLWNSQHVKCQLDMFKLKIGGEWPLYNLLKLFPGKLDRLPDIRGYVGVPDACWSSCSWKVMKTVFSDINRTVSQCIQKPTLTSHLSEMSLFRKECMYR